jgi:Ca2+-binding RTX toxin-like protein
VVFVSVNGYTLAANIETGVISSSAGLALTGNTLDNALFGNTGADTLNGGIGHDSLIGGQGTDAMVGGQGNDAYDVDNLGDVIIENAGEGSDVVFVSITGYGLAANVETGVVTSSDGLVLTGNELSNALFGNVGNDMLNGGIGQDSLIGGAGNDTFSFVAGQANGDQILDFSGNGSAAGDQLEFHGYGTAAQGATLIQLSSTQWQINSADGSTHDIIILANAATLSASDYLFV